MKKGDLVKWNLSWITSRYSDSTDYRSQIGIVTDVWDLGCYVHWNSGKHRKVHNDYLEALCKSVI